MAKKGILLILLLVLLYGVSIFALPQVASSIDKLIGIPGFSDSLRGKKENFDNIVTNIPSLEEFQSGAVDAKEMFSQGLTTTKETIDTIREGAQKAENTYNDAKDTFDQAKQTFDNAKEVFDDVSNKVGQVQEVVNSIQGGTATGGEDK